MRAIVILGVVLATAWVGLEAQDQLSAAKDLYASAAYEDALSVLGRMAGGSIAPEVARQVDTYRAFSLYALGRTSEAESIAESMIRKEPMARLDSADASPRLELMFAEVRKRLLPSLVRERFRAGRDAFDQKIFGAAEPPLTEARVLIAEAEKLGVKDEGLGDLRILVDGFLELVRSGSEQRNASQPAAPAASVAAAGTAVASPPIVPPPAPGSQSPASAGVSDVRVYSVDDIGISPPVALDQRLPALTRELQMITKALRTQGIIDVFIDETGRVVNVTLRQSVNSNFDTVAVRSARNWRYRPAMKDGVPVRYVKTVVLVP